jgi:hypothetical protein
MKRTLASALALVVLVALVPAAHAAERCTAVTLKGNYGFTFSGFVQDDQGNNVPFSGIGLGTLDGEGGASATIVLAVNGNISTLPWTGTYIVNPDCTGSMTATPGSGNANFSIVIVRGGAEFMGVATNPGDTWTIDFKKVD